MSRIGRAHSVDGVDVKDGEARANQLRRSARVLDAAPSAFATEPSIGAAYHKLEELWNDQSLAEGDPRGELLARHARQLRGVLEDLGARPRAVLGTEHRLLKLQTVRRTDSKTLRWLSAQPGRNTAERAGARQRIKAPKRFETIEVLENRVLRAFAALTMREAASWLDRAGDIASRSLVEAHSLRARRIEAILRERGVPEARPPVRPNFALRFDPRYREIWRAWLELRSQSTATESQWMWQHRTFTELLGLRAAMKLHQAARNRPHWRNTCARPCPAGKKSAEPGTLPRRKGHRGYIRNRSRSVDLSRRVPYSR